MGCPASFLRLGRCRLVAPSVSQGMSLCGPCCPRLRTGSGQCAPTSKNFPFHVKRTTFRPSSCCSLKSFTSCSSLTPELLTTSSLQAALLRWPGLDVLCPGMHSGAQLRKDSYPLAILVPDAKSLNIPHKTRHVSAHGADGQLLLEDGCGTANPLQAGKEGKEASKT